MFSKTILLIPALGGLIFGSAGTLLISKAIKPKIDLTCPPAPPCNCPPAVEVNLQTFDLSKLSNKKGSFTYAPSLHNVTVMIQEKDTAMFNAMLRTVKK